MTRQGGIDFIGHRPEIDMLAQAAKVAALKCDVILSAHPDASDMAGKLGARASSNNTFIDPDGCKAYAAGAATRLARRLASERQQRPAAIR